MSNRQMPRLDVGLHIGARRGYDNMPLDRAEAAFRAEYNPTTYMIGQFRTGYVHGQINARLNWLRSWQGYLPREELEQMLADIDPVARKWGYDEREEDK